MSKYFDFEMKVYLFLILVCIVGGLSLKSYRMSHPVTRCLDGVVYYYNNQTASPSAPKIAADGLPVKCS